MVMLPPTAEDFAEILRPQPWNPPEKRISMQSLRLLGLQQLNAPLHNGNALKE